MANTNTLTTRIIICNDTEVNWGTSTKVLLKGEVGVLFPTDTTKEPILKIGDGVNTFNDLKPLNVTPSELTELANKIGDLTTLKTSDKTTIIAAINELVDSAGKVTIDTSKTTDGYAKSYTIKQGVDDDGNDIVIGIIDIPKDMFLSSAEVVVFNEGDTLPDGISEAGTYIEFTIANATNDKIYINVKTLANTYTAKANAAQIQLTIDPVTREISAAIVNGSVGADALADNAIITSKIKDANVTKAKLEQSIQDTLDKADAAIRDVKVNGTALSKDASNAVNIEEISTDILKNGTNTLILDGGTSSMS
ncbi:MAG: hypothetical protein HFH73_03455 [Lachnospiraceae bacterium]|jgi:hypothetical protein|nr:hypothetical protein [Lachnospiraceae bacterium]